MTYEIVSILSPKLSDDEVKAEQDALRQLIEKADGKVLREDSWGKRELSYPINKFAHGIYIQTDFEAEPSFIQQLDKQLKLRDAFVRQLIVKKEQGWGSLSDVEAASEEAAEQQERKGATDTPDVLNLATYKTPELGAKKDIMTTSEAASAPEQEKSEAKKEEKKVDLDSLDEKLDDIIDSSLEEEVH